jgi:hypothetical protein
MGMTVAVCGIQARNSTMSRPGPLTIVRVRVFFIIPNLSFPGYVWQCMCMACAYVCAVCIRLVDSFRHSLASFGVSSEFFDMRIFLSV